MSFSSSRVNQDRRDAAFERAVKKIATTRTCQEVVGMVGDTYLHCGAAAVMRIQHRGRTEGPYDMCQACGEHNVSNRSADVIERF